MVFNKRVPGTVRAARLGLFERCSAQLNGRLDARHLTWSPPSGVSHHTDVRRRPVATPFIRRLQSQTDKSTSQIGARLLSDNTQLVESLYQSAEAVVREKNTNGQATQETQGRFATALAQWRARVVERRFLAEAVVAHHNALVEYYWATVTRRRDRSPERADHPETTYPQIPASIELDQRWLHEDEFFLANGSSVNGQPGRATKTFLRALDVLGGADPRADRDNNRG